VITGFFQKLRVRLLSVLPKVETPKLRNNDPQEMLHDVTVAPTTQGVPSEIIQDSTSSKYPLPKGWLFTILTTSIGVTALIWGVRELEGLQRWELSAYDQMIQLRPYEKPDERILVVTVDEEELKKWPLPDDTINKLLKKLESYQPRVIGLNIYRPLQKNFAVDVVNKKNIIALCQLSIMGDKEIPPPPNFIPDNIGFSDLVPDYEDNEIIRRYFLFGGPGEITKKCNTQSSFSALLAIKYLDSQGIKFKYTSDDPNKFKLGNTSFTRISADAGSYIDIDAAGYQLLINYRNPNNFAPEVSLTKVLQGQVDPKLIKDRLVIVGTTDLTIPPGGFSTPYTSSPQHDPKMPAVFVHAQIASQLISTVLDNRPLIWYWSDWGEYTWIFGWSLVGAILAWRLKYPLRVVLVGSVALGSLVGVCYLIFINAGWIPVIPPALALVLSGATVMIYTAYQTNQQTKYIILEVEKQQEAIEQLNLLLKETGVSDQNKLSFRVDTPIKASGDLLLSGRYRIMTVLASGGFGCTYVAEDTHRPGNPSCVVKQLMPARSDVKFLRVARRLFNTEAEILEVLGKHHQIPELLAFFEENQEFYLVEQYIKGHTLTEELPPNHSKQNEAYVIKILKEILEVLTFIHEHRVIHRDIKPSNIIRSIVDNRLVLIDFGAVKTMQPLNDETTELATVAIGTRGYTPPEQFAGHPRLCSDIYALGMIGIQALTGVQPQELPTNPETGTVVWRYLASVSDDLAKILDKMVQYHFSDRYQSAADVLQDLKKVGS